MKNIRDWLNGAGVTTVRGKKIDLNFVAAILHNRKYIGEYSYRHIVTPGGIPAIVPQDLFDRDVYKRQSFKKYVEAAFPVTLDCDGDVFGVIRWIPAPDRGFTAESSDGYKVTISTSDRKSTRLNSSHIQKSRMPSSA